MTHTPRDFPVLVFDLDATLVDSVPDLLSCANRMLERQALPPMEAAELRPMVGDGLRVLVERILRDQVTDNFSAIWRVCTNKPAADARLLLGLLGVEPLSDAIGGGGSFPVRKPDPAHVLGTIGLAGGCGRRSRTLGWGAGRHGPSARRRARRGLSTLAWTAASWHGLCRHYAT